MSDKADKMAAELNAQSNPALSRFAERGGEIVLITPGAPFTISPTTYSPDDLQRAVELGFLECRPLDYYSATEQSIRFEQMYGLPANVGNA